MIWNGKHNKKKKGEEDSDFHNFDYNFRQDLEEEGRDIAEIPRVAVVVFDKSRY